MNKPSMKTVMEATESASKAGLVSGTSNWCAHVANHLNRTLPAEGCTRGLGCACRDLRPTVRRDCAYWERKQ